MDWMALLQALAPIIGPIFTWLFKTYVLPNVPPAVLPMLATALGTGAALAGGAQPAHAVALGGSGVAVREILDQLYKPRVMVTGSKA